MDLRLVNAGAVVDATVLFSGLDLVVSPGTVTGVIGPNGCGKTTLLRVLAGQRPLDEGQRLVSAGLRVGWMPQRRAVGGSLSIKEYLAHRTGVAGAQRELDAASLGLVTQTQQAADRYDTALQAWLELGGADFDQRSMQAMQEVGLHIGADRDLGSLSGGQAARLDLAVLLLSRHDVLLLDEPTNDLDMAGLDLLERIVAGSAAGIVVVSHDRAFLSATLTAVLEFDPVLDQVLAYAGGYAAYLRERERARERAVEQYARHEQQMSDLHAAARAAELRSHRGVRHADRAYRQGKVDKLTRDRMRDGATAGANKSREIRAQLDRMDDVPAPRKTWQLRMSIPHVSRSGEVVFTADRMSVTRGDFTLGPVTCQVNEGETVLITGDNGSGKTTLLDVLTGTLPADEGRVALGAGVRLGRIDQRRDLPGESLLAAVHRRLTDLDDSEVRTLLAKFGLAGADLGRRPRQLSPGEITRAQLAILQGEGCNTLIADEPTNHLDLMAVEQVEEALTSFPGTLLVVSHDRRLLSALQEKPVVRWHLAAGHVEQR